MTRQEKFILLIIALLGLSRIGGILRDIFISSHYGTAGVPAGDKQLWVTASLALHGLVNVGAACWLFAEAKSVALKSWLWALFGLCFGLFGVALFYLVLIAGKQRASET